MSENTLEGEVPQINKAKTELYKNSAYVSLYRYENNTIPYDEKREGVVSKKELVGDWYTDNLADLKTYTLTRIRGKRGGKFIVVRVKKEDLNNYDASINPDTKDMDIETGNYVIPPVVGKNSRIEVEGIFKDEWEGKANVPFADWKEIENYIEINLSDQAIIAKLETNKF